MEYAGNATRRLKAGMMMLAAAVVLAASLVPACGTLCCSNEGVAFRGVMPCCETQPKLERADALRMPAATSVAAPAVAALPVAIVAGEAPARVDAWRENEPPNRESSPPLFLRNAQLLI